MSLSISAIAPTLDPPVSSSTTKEPAVKPTASQQIQALASGGQSAAAIASSLGLPISQVDSTLGITSSSTNQASALLALSGRLSVKA
jgi:hypothetical protein